MASRAKLGGPGEEGEVCVKGSCAGHLERAEENPQEKPLGRRSMSLF